MLPLFLFAAGHVKNDLPLALAEGRRAFPTTRFGAARALGVDPGLVDLAYARAQAHYRRRVVVLALSGFPRGRPPAPMRERRSAAEPLEELVAQ